MFTKKICSLWYKKRWFYKQWQAHHNLASLVIQENVKH